MSHTSTLQHPADQSTRTISHRTRGSHFRFIRPDSLGRVVKPFVYFDLFDKDGPKMMFGLHPHSGIATVTHVFEGAIDYTDPDGTSKVRRHPAPLRLQNTLTTWNPSSL